MQICDTVRGLDGQVGSLIGESGDASLRAKNAGDGAAQIQGIIARVQHGVTRSARRSTASPGRQPPTSPIATR